MDLRHTYQKLDWLTWGATLAPNGAEFTAMFSAVFRMANSTKSRWPLTDLYDTVTGDITWLGPCSFRSRPVVGAVFAPMLVPGL